MEKQFEIEVLVTPWGSMALPASSFRWRCRAVRQQATRSDLVTDFTLSGPRLGLRCGRADAARVVTTALELERNLPQQADCDETLSHCRQDRRHQRASKHN